MKKFAAAFLITIVSTACASSPKSITEPGLAQTMALLATPRADAYTVAYDFARGTMRLRESAAARFADAWVHDKPAPQFTAADLEEAQR